MNIMKWFSITIAVLSLALGGLPLFRVRSRASLWLVFPKFLGTALAPYVVLAGVLGAALGLMYRSSLAIGAGTAGAVLAADYMRRVTASHDGFKRAFGANWANRIPPESEQRMLQRRWTWWVSNVPEPRWTRDVIFWNIHGNDPKFLADIWQPPAGVKPTGTAIVYLHGSAWYLWDKDCGTRPFFRSLAAQGHVIMDVAYRLCPDVDIVGMVGDAKRAVAWMKANAVRFGINPQQVVIMGASAGGHIALLAAYSSNHPRLTPEELHGVDTSVRAVVSYYGVPDMRAYCEYTVSRFGGSPEQPPAAAERPKPGRLAAASIGQAHAATLRDGTNVVVKVRRPGVVEQVEEDLEILQNLASTMSRHWEFAAIYDVEGLAQEFANTLRSELNYLQEARNAESFAYNFADDSKVHIPRIFWEMTTSRVLTLERIRGVKVSDLDSLEANGIDRRDLAERGTQVILKMIFEDGFFHADLHPGNFFIEPDGRFGLIDFGMVGAVDERLQERLAGLLLALASADYDQLVDALFEMGMAGSRIDRDTLRRDLERLISPYYGRPLGEINLTPLLNDALAIVHRHRMRLPSNLALLLKTVIITEDLGARLDPDFCLLSVIEPYTNRLLLNLYSPAHWLRKLKRAGLDIAWLGAEAPQQLRRLIGVIERSGFEFGMSPESFEPLIKRLERIANRIILGILAAAFVVGLATLLSVYRTPGWENWAGAMFATGFFFAIALGIYLASSILRSGREVK